MDLFNQKNNDLTQSQTVPLAERVRPKSLDEFVGQQHLIAPGKVLRQAIESDRLVSMIFWGPPGVGKTTLARIIAGVTKSEFFAISAVTSGVKEVRKIIEQADFNRTKLGKRQYYLSTKFTVSTKPNRMRFYTALKMVPFYSLALQQKIPLLKSFLRCCHEHVFTHSNIFLKKILKLLLIVRF